MNIIKDVVTELNILCVGEVKSGKSLFLSKLTKTSNNI